MKNNEVTKKETEIDIEIREVAQAISDISKETGLTPYEHWFVYHFSKGNSGPDSVNLARKEVGAKAMSKEAAAIFSTKMLTKAKVKKAIKQFSEITFAKTGNRIAEAYENLTETFLEASEDKANLNRVDKAIARYDALIDKAELDGDIATMLQLTKLQQDSIKTREKLLDNIGKNITRAHAVAGPSKAKPIVTASTVNIIAGNQTIEAGTQTSKYLEEIEIEAKEKVSEIVDIDGID